MTAPVDLAAAGAHAAKVQLAYESGETVSYVGSLEDRHGEARNLRACACRECMRHDRCVPRFCCEVPAPSGPLPVRHARWSSFLVGPVPTEAEVLAALRERLGGTR